MQSLQDALALWRGPALADFAYDQWAQEEIGRLEDLRLVAREQLTDARLALGEHRVLVGELEAFTAEHPLRERTRAQLMLALYRCGRQAEALQVYLQGRERLVEELGIDPSHELQALYRQILNQDEALTLTPARPSETNLPAQPAPLIGRNRELAELQDLIGRDDVRLLTLTGPGGTGKTRLALELASELVGNFSAGVFFVNLAPLTDATLVLPTIAQALRVRERGGSRSAKLSLPSCARGTCWSCSTTSSRSLTLPSRLRGWCETQAG